MNAIHGAQDPYRLPPPPGPYRADAYGPQAGQGPYQAAAPRQRTAIACRYCRRRKVRGRSLPIYELPRANFYPDRFVARDSRPRQMDDAATVFDSTKTACSLRFLRKPKPLCLRTPPTLIYDLDKMDQDQGAVVDRLSCTALMDNLCLLNSSHKAPRPPCRRLKGCTIRTDDRPWTVPRFPLRQLCPIR